ncbi:LAME_0B06502g1_1 [Lachancea meyersii CBS 8951]|uniref:LAME_0B06502g1_1 n=1 Tax=Lachancea meyersii CBS 8951 TaxID=1266667 RepID=A0A1G4IWG4_9SACH|nr:LAME_0B06502g1_1 [Lachancea meyersii CBS 8951]
MCQRDILMLHDRQQSTSRQQFHKTLTNILWRLLLRNKYNSAMTSSGLILTILASSFVATGLEFFKSDPFVACSSDEHCPEEWPCCSQYGQCGYGPLCMGGCDPRYSFSYESCAVIPAMYPQESSSYEALGHASTDSQEKIFGPLLAVNLFFDGPEDTIYAQSEPEDLEIALSGRGLVHYSKSANADVKMDDFDFTYSGFLELSRVGGDAGLVLAMPPDTTGSLISSSKSFLYGRVAVTMKTARGNGVVSAMVLMSAVKDEVDFEFLGGDLDNAQSNYYYRGELVHTRMLKSPIQPNSYEEYHTYEFDWDEDRIQWLIDGSVVRTLHRDDTYDSIQNIYKYPATPMRLEIALWPGGVKSNNPGTVMWAGGLIDWDNAADIVEKGQFQISVKSVQISPYVNAFVPLGILSGGVGLSDTSSDKFYYFYDPKCEGCVRSRWDLPAKNDQKIHQKGETVDVTTTSTTTRSLPQVISTVFASSTTTGSPARNETSFVSSTKVNVTSHKNLAVPTRYYNIFMRIQTWLTSWILR